MKASHFYISPPEAKNSCIFSTPTITRVLFTRPGNKNGQKLQQPSDRKAALSQRERKPDQSGSFAWRDRGRTFILFRSTGATERKSVRKANKQSRPTDRPTTQRGSEPPPTEKAPFAIFSLSLTLQNFFFRGASAAKEGVGLDPSPLVRKRSLFPSLRRAFLPLCLQPSANRAEKAIYVIRPLADVKKSEK